jgi:glycosyltransferase involved in cell wall biosynthesis
VRGEGDPGVVGQRRLSYAPLTSSSSPRPSPELISVVIPVLNGEKHVGEQLAALAAQTYDCAWEVVIVDNGCTDRTLEVVFGWRNRLPAVTIVDARARPGLNHARNAGAAAARGELLAFCDADDVATPGWLAALAEAAREADMVGGRNEWDRLNDAVICAWRPSTPMTGLMRDHGFLPYASGGNLGVWRDVALKIGWDERFIFGSSDQVFAWRAQLAGYRLTFAPDAVMEIRFRRTLPGLARQFYRYGRSGAQLHRAFRDAGIPPADNRTALRLWGKLARRLPDLWGTRAQRGGWIRLAAFRLGRLVGSLRARALVL